MIAASGFEEEPRTALLCPSRKIIATSFDFVADLLNAEDLSYVVARDQPVPESRTETQTVMKILCLDEHVGIK